MVIAGAPWTIVVSAQAAWPRLAEARAIGGFPVPSPITIQPRVFLAYAALTGAALLTLLYCFRGRAFILYWITSWLLLAGALGLIARDYGDAVIGTASTALALLFIVWSSGLVLLAAHAFPRNGVDHRQTAAWAAGLATAFLVAPFVAPLVVAISVGTLAMAFLLGWAGSRYFRIGRRDHYAGAFLMAAGVWVAAAVNLAAGAAVLFGFADLGLGRLTLFNVVNSLVIALAMHLLVFEDMTQELRLTNRELAAAHEEVKRLAITDPLTGCHNRRFFDEIERREIQRHRRYAVPMSVMFVDVNHFKRLNDSFGHDRGDDALRMIGTLLRDHVRESDYVIRWGGDEFLLMLTCSETEAQAKAEELKLAFARGRSASAIPDYVGLSVGVASVSRGADTLREAIRYADSRMYRDKLTLRGQAAV